MPEAGIGKKVHWLAKCVMVYISPLAPALDEPPAALDLDLVDTFPLSFNEFI
jgi:hypothetical protein